MLIVTKKHHLSVAHNYSLEKVMLQICNVWHCCNKTAFCPTRSTGASPHISADELQWHMLVGELESLDAAHGSSGCSLPEEFAVFTHPWWVCRSESQQWVMLSASSQSQYSTQLLGHLCLSPLLDPCVWLRAGAISSHQLGSPCYLFWLVSREMPQLQSASSRNRSKSEEENG